MKLGRISAAIDSFGDLHILINNAGILRDAMSFSMNEKQFDEVIAVHLKGAFCLCSSCSSLLEGKKQNPARNLLEGLSIQVVNLVYLVVRLKSNYASAKGGILTLSITLGRELSKYGVTTNVVAQEQELV